MDLCKRSNLDRVFETRADPATGEPWKHVKFQPALIQYRIGKARFTKTPDADDLALLTKIEALALPLAVPTNRFPIEEMPHGSRIAPKGFTHVHHFYLPRAAQALGALWQKVDAVGDKRLRAMLFFWIEQAVLGLSVLNRYQPIQQGRLGGSQVNRQLTGVYYIASQHAEVSPRYNLGLKLERLEKAFARVYARHGITATNTGTAAQLALPDESVDYIFTDPPFGENIPYADLNFLVESWHRVWTNAKAEATVDSAKRKGLPEYQHLMEHCFLEYCRVLKPGHWMTVEFHNSRNSVWNAIQEALQRAGFVVADVRTLDKQSGSYRQVTSTAVKQDLIISAYKPNGGLEERFKLVAGTEEGVWDFVRTHLNQLPRFVCRDGKAEVTQERTNYLLFDRMVAFHVQRGVLVPLSANEFYQGLVQRFPQRDGMFFLPDQVAEYDKKRMTVRELLQLQLFVNDEASSIQWLKQQLSKKPQTFQELHPQFVRELGGWQKHEKPLELSDLLKDNFLRYEGRGPIPPQVVSWMKHSDRLRVRIREIEAQNAASAGAPLETSDLELMNTAKDRWYVPDPNKAGDLEKLRERALLREFEELRTVPGRKLKVFRLEAVRAGFMKAWRDRDYRTIVDVAAKIPDAVLQEDPKLLQFYDNAQTRLGADL